MDKKEAYTVKEVAAMMGLSRQTITRIFQGEPDVIKLARPETMYKRVHTTMRIPHYVYQRVLRRLSVK